MKPLALAAIYAIGPIAVCLTAICRPPPTFASCAGMFASFLIKLLLDKIARQPPWEVPA